MKLIATFLITLSFFCSLDATARELGILPCLKALISRNSVLETWRELSFTDPHQHSPKKFTYIAHAVRFTDTFAPEHFADRAQKLIDDPYSIASQGWISASLISERKKATYGNEGLLLEIVPEHLAHTSPRDAWFRNRQGRLGPLSGRDQPTILPPEIILWRTHRYRVNEIVLRGTVNIGDVPVRVRPVAYFVRTFQGVPLTYFFEVLRKASIRNNLPLIEIPLD